jgi:DNA-directed RNA polymerase specialized sigma24 family protein
MNELSMVLAGHGTPPDFGSLLQEEFNQVLSYVQRLVGDVTEAHRISEETFDQAARYFRKGKTPNGPRALVYFIATARAREFLKKGHKRGFLQRMFGHEPEPVVSFAEEDVKSLASDTSQRALSTLDFGDRVVLLLHDYCGLTYAEVARAAGIGRGSVARDLDRARHAFKKAYDYIKF